MRTIMEPPEYQGVCDRCLGWHTTIVTIPTPPSPRLCRSCRAWTDAESRAR